ncbi:MAG: hypothetical protein A2X36_06575 [Elusimicrobia bacterium GWA2_69_24]|nr:MAG: hypothetical protein A2X36_06575 [Elusimicrobia bacterium GWA2_69_24]HBL17958.1 hypothetical protein [Elusimicrobiota bacterium]
MNCPDFEVISAYSDGEATPEEVRVVAAHVRECESCFLRLRSVESAKLALRRVPAPRLPRDLRRTLLEAGPGLGDGRAAWRRFLEELRAGLLHPASVFSIGAAVVAAFLFWGRNEGLLTPRIELPADLLVAAHNQYALTLPLAPTERILTEMPDQIAASVTGPAEGRGVY